MLCSQTRLPSGLPGGESIDRAPPLGRFANPASCPGGAPGGHHAVLKVGLYRWTGLMCRLFAQAALGAWERPGALHLGMAASSTPCPAGLVG